MSQQPQAASAAKSLASTVLIDGESTQQFEEFLNALIAHYRPVTAIERGLLDTMAAARWRQMRAWSMLRTALDKGKIGENATILRYEATHRRQFNSALKELRSVKEHRDYAAQFADLLLLTNPTPGATSCPEDLEIENQKFQFTPSPTSGHSGPHRVRRGRPSKRTSRAKTTHP